MEYDIGIVRRRRIISPNESYFGVPATGGGSASWTKTDNPAIQSVGANPVVFTAVNLGASVSGRITVVVAHCEITGQTGMTIGGLTATEAVHEFSAISGLGIWYCDTSSLGSSGNIVVSAGGTMGENAIMVGRLTGCALTPTATNSANNAGADPSTITATVPAGGFGIVGLGAASDVTGTASWTNATQDYVQLAGDGQTRTMAYTGTAGSQTPSYGGLAGSTTHIVIACWGP